MGDARNRLGHALPDLPLIDGAFPIQEISYATVRILTRWADPDNEADLLAVPPSTGTRNTDRRSHHGHRADQGAGIADGGTQRIFDLFYRADSTRSPGQPATGLGLSIARAPRGRPRYIEPP